MRAQAPQHGFSLVEVFVGIAVIIFVLSSGALVLHYVTRSEVNTAIGSKVDQKLHSIAEEIRQRAQTEFNTMTGTVKLRADSMYPQIRVTKIIDLADPTVGTRMVRLQAAWREAGRNEVKDLTFFVAPIRGHYVGGRVILRIINGLNSNLGIKGVGVTAAGQDAPEVKCISDDSGLCELNGVQMVSGLPFHVDGYPVAYFHDPGNDLSVSMPAGNWTGVHVEGQTITPYAVVEINISMYPTAQVEGIIMDKASSVHVPQGVVVGLRKIPGTLVIDNTSDLTTHTDGKGTFIFKNVVPGKYSVHVMGDRNNGYAATGTPGDYNPTGRVLLANLAPLKSGHTVYFDDAGGGDANHHHVGSLQTIKRGSFQLQLQGLEWNGIGFVAGPSGPDASHRVPIILASERTHSYPVSTGNSLEFNDTVPFREFYQVPHSRYSSLSQAAREKLTVNVGDSNANEIKYVTPAVFDKDDISHPLDQQYGRARVEPNFYVPDPFVPVLAVRPDITSDFSQTNLKLMNVGLWFYFDWVVQEGSNYRFSPSQYGDSRDATYEDFTFKIFANHLNFPSENRNNFDDRFYILNKNALARVTGTLVNGPEWDGKAGEPFNPCPSLHESYSYNTRCLQISKVYTYFWDKGFGGVKKSITHVGMNFLAHAYGLPTGIDSEWSKSNQHPHPAGGGGEPLVEHTYTLQSVPEGAPCWNGLDTPLPSFHTVHTCLGVPPNMGNDVTKIFYIGGLQPDGTNKSFQLNFQGIEKIMGTDVSKTISISTITDTMTIHGLQIKTSPNYSMGGATQSPENISNWATTLSRPGFTARNFIGSTNVHLVPGENSTDPNLVIEVDKGNPDHSPYTVTVENDDNNEGDDENWQFVPPPGNVDSAYRYDGSQYKRNFPLQINRKVNVKVSVRVVQADNNAIGISHVKVTLYDSEGITLKEGSTGDDGWYTFPDIKVAPKFDKKADLGIHVNAVGYEPSTDQTFEVYNEPKDGSYGWCGYVSCREISADEFRLSPIISGSGTNL